ncbi:MAG: hypothetical protein M1827_001646 [Pycnora praestabilis]|nr:MAG: hypothetical protein M1827_001646 [Pycnora praestabilis]
MPKVTKNNLPRQNQYGPVQGAPDETQIRFLIFVKHILFQNTGQKNFQAVTDAYNREYGTHYKLNALSSQLSRRRIHQDLEVDSTGNVPDEFKEEFQSLVDRFKVKRSLSNDLSTEVSATQDISDVEVSVLGRRQQVRLLEQTNIDGLSTRTRGALGPDDLSLFPVVGIFTARKKGSVTSMKDYSVPVTAHFTETIFTLCAPPAERPGLQSSSLPTRLPFL